jgi:catechol 2,3-dioxygenase-like lactoylglutathione lyase family enzyme
MISGAHCIIYSTDAEADRAFFKDILGLPHVDVGDGWLIFGLPPAEIAIHPDAASRHEVYLMCDDIEAFVAAVEKRGVKTDPIANRGWGLLANVHLPGGGTLGVYQPRHARPPSIV